MEAVYANIKRVSIGLYNIISNIHNKNQLEQKITYSTILKGPKGKGLGHNNTYGRYRQYKGINWLSG